MIKIRRAILTGADSTVTVLDMGHGVTMTVRDKFGAPLVQDIARLEPILGYVNTLASMLEGKNLRLDAMDEFLTQLKERGYKMQSEINSTELSNDEMGLKVEQ